MPEATEVDVALLRGWALPAAGTDKEERGRVLVAGGSRATPGAALLAAEAAFRVGCGKVRVATVRSCATALAVAVPELAVTALDEDGAGNILPSQAERLLEHAERCSAVLVGPGLTDVANAAALVEGLAPNLRTTLVVDAVASAYVTEEPGRVADLAAPVVLTLNPTELAHCLHTDEDEVDGDLESHTAALSQRTGATVLCGGRCKIVASAEGLWRVDAGNHGLGISGSGDVQAGLVAGLIGRGASPVQAAVWGAFLHATAGDRLAERIGPVGYLARELPGEVPALLACLDARAMRDSAKG